MHGSRAEAWRLSRAHPIYQRQFYSDEEQDAGCRATASCAKEQGLRLARWSKTFARFLPTRISRAISKRSIGATNPWSIRGLDLGYFGTRCDSNELSRGCKISAIPPKPVLFFRLLSGPKLSSACGWPTVRSALPVGEHAWKSFASAPYFSFLARKSPSITVARHDNRGGFWRDKLREKASFFHEWGVVLQIGDGGFGQGRGPVDGLRDHQSGLFRADQGWVILALAAGTWRRAL